MTAIPTPAAVGQQFTIGDRTIQCMAITPNYRWKVVARAKTPTTGIVDTINGLFLQVSNGAHNVALDMPFAGKITKVSVQSESGTCTISTIINGTAIAVMAASSAINTEFHSNAFSIGDNIKFGITNNASCLGLAFTIEIVRA